ncbi:MAG: hypothetical protein ACM3XO_22870 [Bacteroidota bacterium]
MKRLDWFEIALIVVVMSVSLYAAFADGQSFSWNWFTRDDAYYYFKVAQNISEGHGSTFDGINKTNGYHPLWMLICVPIFALARFDLILPLRVLLLVMSGLSVATGILLYRLVGRVFAPAIGAIAAIFWVFSVDILTRFYKQGLETGIAAFLIVLFVYKLFDLERSWRTRAVAKKDLILVGAIGALVIFSRLDLIFFIAFAGIWVVFRSSPIRYLMPLDVVSIAFSVLLAFVLKSGFPDYYDLATVAVTMIVIGMLVKLPLAYLSGLYTREKTDRFSGLIVRLAVFVLATSAVSGGIMVVIARRLSFSSFPRTVIMYDAALTFLLFLLSRLLVLGLKTAGPVAAPQTESPVGYFRRNWRQWLLEGAWYYGVSFGALAVYMLWSKFAFGTFSPVSGQIKRWWGSLSGRVYGGSANNFLSFFGVSYGGDSNAWHPVSTLLGTWAENWRIQILDVWRYAIILSVFALIFYCLLLINRPKARTSIARLAIVPLFCGAVFQVFYYHMLGYSAYKDWYWIIQMVLIVLVLSLMLGMLYQAFRRFRWTSTITWGLATVYALYLGSAYFSYINSNMTHGQWAADAPYMDISAFLEQHTEPGSIIGMTGGGNTGYFIHDRTIVNMDGLINSYQYFQMLQEKEAGKYLADIGMNYVLANIQLLDGLPYRGQYREYLQRTDFRYGGKELSHYRAPQP